MKKGQFRRNKNNGMGFEHRFVKKRLADGAKRAIRHYGSRGVTDVEWTDQLGFKNEAQLKYSTVKMPVISKKEMERIRPYATAKKLEGIKVWIVRKQAHGPEVWEACN